MVTSTEIEQSWKIVCHCILYFVLCHIRWITLPAPNHAPDGWGLKYGVFGSNLIKPDSQTASQGDLWSQAANLVWVSTTLIPPHISLLGQSTSGMDNATTANKISLGAVSFLLMQSKCFSYNTIWRTYFLSQHSVNMGHRERVHWMTLQWDRLMLWLHKSGKAPKMLWFLSLSSFVN